jgi:hypothetical protein
MAPKAADARKRLTRNHRFRGHGPLLQEPWPSPRQVVHHGHCRRGPWPRKRWRQGNASTGTVAFVGEARSYKSAACSDGRDSAERRESL